MRKIHWARTPSRLAASRAVGAVLVGVLVGGYAQHVPPAGAQLSLPSSATVSAAKASTALPRAARVEATVAGWRVAGPEKIGEIAPEVGSASNGSLSLAIDAPTVRTSTQAADTTFDVTPNTTYTFHARVRQMVRTPSASGVSFQVGAKKVALPKLDAKWRTVTAVYVSGESETSASIKVNVSKAVRGFAMDDVRLTAPDGTNVVPNGSFEQVEVARGIVSTSLVMATATAMVAVAQPQGAVSWEVFRGKKKVKSGSFTQRTPVAGISMSGVSQGLYTLKVRARDKKVVQTSIALVDSPNPWIAPDARFGVGLHIESPLYAEAGRYSRDLGIPHVRNDLLWAFNEKSKGKYRFDTYDNAMARLDAQGVGVLGIVNYGNAAYGKANASAPVTKEAVNAYGRYAAQLAKRYRLTGLEVFNEFNWPAHNKSSCRSAKCYLPLLTAVDREVAKVNPRLPIVAGATAKYQDAWFTSLWKSGGLNKADAMSFHPYEITGKPEGVAPLVKSARAGMKKHGKKVKPVWLTELGTSSAVGNRTQAQQASILVRTATTALGSGAQRFYWYDLINDGTRAKEHFDNFGLYEHKKSGVAALAPKQSGFAQALMITQLGGRKFSTSERLGSGVVSQAFGGAADRVRVVWAPSGKKVATIKSKTPVVVVNFDGTKRTVKPKSGIVKISVTAQPVFVRSGKATVGVTK